MSAPSRNLVGWIAIIVGIVGIAVRVFALPPEQWKSNLGEWNSWLAGLYSYALIIGLACLVFGIGVLWHINRIQVNATRAEWWNRNIQSVIRDSEKLVVIDSVFGHKHVFWHALSKRFESAEPFDLIYLMLSDDNPFLLEIMKLIEIEKPASMTKVDKDMIAGLKGKFHRPSSKKTVEFGFWEGISPGPLIAWTKDGKETIGLGFWMHLTEATDGTPYVIVKRGPLFKSLKRHYEAIIQKTRLNSRPGS